MEKHRAVIVGAGRIGAAYSWADRSYSHAGAMLALKDRIELLSFVDPSRERRESATAMWGVPAYETLEEALIDKPDVVSVCTGPDDRGPILSLLDVSPSVKGVFCEKPWRGMHMKKPVQTNYLRRADPDHKHIAHSGSATLLIVYGKDDETTRCHFEDLAKFWRCKLDYRPFNGPCAYYVAGSGGRFFDNGGINAGACMKSMLENLLDHLDNPRVPLYSPAFERAGS